MAKPLCVKDQEHVPYFRPNDLRSALDWLADHDAAIAAGCTDLFPATSAQQLAGAVLDITAIPDLRGVSSDATHWRLGATTTWTDIIEADLPPAFTALKLAAREVGSRQIQNVATLAGNLCNASPAADGVPCLLALDAEVELRSRHARRVVPLNDFITGVRAIDRARDELVTAILVPRSSTRGTSSFLKLGARKYLIISIAMVAARLAETDGIIDEVAISVGACSATAMRLPDVEAALIGQPVSGAIAQRATDTLIAGALSPIDDLRSDASGRQVIAGELVRRCITALTPGAPTSSKADAA